MNFIRDRIFSLCPVKSKKFIFISSILALIKSIKDPDDELIAKLNEIFKIVEYPNALILPMYIKNFIWKDIDKGVINLNGSNIHITDLPNLKLTEDETTIVSSFFIDKTPDWLKYASRKTMIDDVTTLINDLLPELQTYTR